MMRKESRASWLWTLGCVRLGCSRAVARRLTASSQRFTWSALLSPNEAAGDGAAAASARHETVGFNEENIALLNKLVPAIKSTTQKKVLEALERIHKEVHADLQKPKDFSALLLKPQDIGAISSRLWLPVIGDKKKLKGKSTKFINQEHAERLMATLCVFADRASDFVHYKMDKKDGLVRLAAADSAAAPPPPLPAPLPPPPEPEEAAEAEPEVEAEEEDAGEPLQPLPEPAKRPQRCPWQPLGGALCGSRPDVHCDNASCGQSHCVMLQERRGYPPCAAHRAPAR
jgi:hypothetical protein